MEIIVSSEENVTLQIFIIRKPKNHALEWITFEA